MYVTGGRVYAGNNDGVRCAEVRRTSWQEFSSGWEWWTGRRKWTGLSGKVLLFVLVFSEAFRGVDVCALGAEMLPKVSRLECDLRGRL